ncbi:hypothetical protein ATE84_0886 [Aquimarina sp. MAR_2010_214]|uniref:hypothetical protein n=1 Tax=Aquimarina sp. MAR_2010_214 TaxID=1250026 RepID=UPI000C7060ED|nr:hypothetical protein [Aquimarina sp. MAR_2010_214]PKV48871.1 hypothetical protein ATE84_0886 [Aquimarina sp. MAR_2010_214]
MTDLEIKKNISDKAIEYGIPTIYSFLYDDLSDDFKNEFESSLNITDFGIPIVKYGHPNGNWVIIGTKKLAIKMEVLNFIPAEQIKGFEVPKTEKEKAKRNQPDRMNRKFEYEVLTLNIHSSEPINIWLNKRLDYYGFWHVMIRFLKLKNDDNTKYDVIAVK